LAAEAFLTGFHGAVAGRYYHGTKLDAGTALLAEIRADAKRIVYMALLASSDKAFRVDSP
jgi:hypothetical protein